MSPGRAVFVNLAAGRAHYLGVLLSHLLQEGSKSFTAVTAQNVETLRVHVATHDLASIPLKSSPRK